jgi:hypothetical protein
MDLARYQEPMVNGMLRISPPTRREMNTSALLRKRFMTDLKLILAGNSTALWNPHTFLPIR